MSPNILELLVQVMTGMGGSVFHWVPENVMVITGGPAILCNGSPLSFKRQKRETFF